MSKAAPGRCRGCGCELTRANARASGVTYTGRPVWMGACRECERAEGRERRRLAKLPCPYCVGYLDVPDDPEAIVMILPDGSVYDGELAPPHRWCLAAVEAYQAEHAGDLT